VETTLQLPIDVDGQRVDADTRLARAGGYVVVLSTVIPDLPLALELHSTYVGHPDHETLSTHLMLAADLDAPVTVGDVHSAAVIDVLRQPRSCLYDHAVRLQEFVASLGHEARIHVTSRAVTAAETSS